MGRAIGARAAGEIGRIRTWGVIALPGTVAGPVALPSATRPAGPIAGPGARSGAGPRSRPPSRIGSPNTSVKVAIVAVSTPIRAVAVNIHMDAVAVPIAGVREPRTDGNTGRKRDGSRRMVLLDNDDSWLINGHIDHGGARGDDRDG